MTLRTIVISDPRALAERAADDVSAYLREALAARPRVTAMFATGVSQMYFLAALIARPGIDWRRVDMCHLDEYVGIAPDHPASLVRYLKERLLAHLPFGSTLIVDGTAEPRAECARLKAALAGRAVDLALVGIGENGHLAFNDPPADFTTTEPYIVVELDEPCRRQQVGEGWFSDIAQVPTRGISASINFILAARRISCLAPQARKAQAVRDCLTGPISPSHPASALRRHGDAILYLDDESAALLPSALRIPA